MREPFLVVASVIGFALLVFVPSKASACGLYYRYGYYGDGCGCCWSSYCYGWVRGRGFNRPYAYSRYGYYGYRYPRYGYPLARGYVRRELRRRW